MDFNVKLNQSHSSIKCRSKRQTAKLILEFWPTFIDVSLIFSKKWTFNALLDWHWEYKYTDRQTRVEA